MKFHSSFLVLLFLCSMMVLVSCNSGGLGIPCNVHPNQVPQGRFGTLNRQKAFLSATNQTEENVVPMWWTLAPEWSDVNAQRNGYTNTPRYTVRTADGPAAQDPTSYVPGQFMDIVIRTLVQEQQFAGLLLYAQKGTGETGERVGEWILPPRQNYQIDPRSGCVTHKNADPKNYKSVFRVRFPRGTGTVTIKALVKVGLAFPEMQGAFYWPNTRAQGFLTLTEQTNNLPTISWFQGNIGQSCNQVCQNQGGQCDLATMRSVGANPSQLLAAVSKSTSCFGPVMKACGSFAPTTGTEGCFFSDTTCTRDPIQSTYDPCLVPGVTAWTLTNPRTRYHMLGNGDRFPTCVSHQGALWCATGFTDGEPSANNGQWRRVATCGTAGNPSLSFPSTPRSAEPSDCTSVRTMAQDGQRLCACTGANQPSGATLPPPGIPDPVATVQPTAQPPATTQTPTNRPTQTPTQAPTNRPTQAPTSAPTPATRDSLMISNPPRMIPRDGPFTLQFAYSAVGARTIAADILSSGFEYFGGTFINVAAGTSGIVTLTITLNPNTQVGGNYMINYYMVDQQIFNNGQNPDAWRSAIQLNIEAQPVMITADPIPTEPPTEAPTDNPDVGTNPDPVIPSSPTTRPPTVTPRPPALKNGAFTSTPSIVLVSILSLVCGGFHSFTSRGMMVLCFIGMMMLSTGLPTAEAHNWLTSPARSNRGTGVNGNFNGWTSPPCPARSTRIHAQVGSGQRFPVEWASGHGYGSSTYLVVVRTENESQLRDLSEPLMDRYLAEAPGTPYMADTKAWHVFPGAGQRLGSLDREVTNDPLYRRPANFRPYTRTSTWLKTADATKNDKRAAYTNSKYPWIIAIHRFALHEDRPDDMDGAFVEIPQGQPAGSYIVYYFWRGYYDCMDINVLGTAAVSDVWGAPLVPATYGYERALHTTYPSTRNRFRVIGECKAINEFEGIDACLQECTRDYNQNNDETCQAVITVPIQLPAGLTMKGTFNNGQSHLPDTCQQVASRVLNPRNTFVCYNVYGGDAPSVGPATKTVYDPEDPVFYHTAYLIRKPWKFADECTACRPLPPPLDWRFADKCISCADTAKNLLSTNVQPTWNFIDNCQHCDATFG